MLVYVAEVVYKGYINTYFKAVFYVVWGIFYQLKKN